MAHPALMPPPTLRVLFRNLPVVLSVGLTVQMPCQGSHPLYSCRPKALCRWKVWASVGKPRETLVFCQRRLSLPREYTLLKTSVLQSSPLTPRAPCIGQRTHSSCCSLFLVPWLLPTSHPARHRRQSRWCRTHFAR